MMYTVILKRPNDVGTLFGMLDHDIDIVILSLGATTAREAAKVAQMSASMRDHLEMCKLCAMTEKDKPKPRDYRILAVFEGDHTACLTGIGLLMDPL